MVVAVWQPKQVKSLRFIDIDGLATALPIHPWRHPSVRCVTKGWDKIRVYHFMVLGGQWRCTSTTRPTSHCYINGGPSRWSSGLNKAKPYGDLGWWRSSRTPVTLRTQGNPLATTAWSPDMWFLPQSRDCSAIGRGHPTTTARILVRLGILLYWIPKRECSPASSRSMMVRPRPRRQGLNYLT